MYHFTSGKSNPIRFDHFRFLLGLISDTKNGKTDLKTVKLEHINLLLDLKKISKGNKKYKLKEQNNALNNIKMLYDAREKIIKWYHDYSLIAFKAKHAAAKASEGTGLKILTPKQTLQRLPIALA